MIRSRLAAAIVVGSRPPDTLPSPRSLEYRRRIPSSLVLLRAAFFLTLIVFAGRFHARFVARFGAVPGGAAVDLSARSQTKAVVTVEADGLAHFSVEGNPSDGDVKVEVGTSGDSSCPTCDRSYVAKVKEGCCTCCTNRLVTVHKMGYVLLQNLARDAFSGAVGTEQIARRRVARTKGHRWYDAPADSPLAKEYREVVVTRNWYDALVSGYLYHKSGRECWKNAFGKALRKEIKAHDRWTQAIPKADWDTMVDPPANGRGLCRYLAETSDFEGLMALTAWALNDWLIPLKEHVAQSEERTGHSLHICYEDLVEPATRNATETKIAEWFEGGGRDRTSRLRRGENYINVGSLVDSAGGHTTDQSVELRERLRGIIEELDNSIFNGQILRGNKIFGCGSGSHTEKA